MKNYELKGERVKRNLTQLDMAKMLGLKTLQGYAMKENGQRKFTIDEIKLIAKRWKLTSEEMKKIFF